MKHMKASDKFVLAMFLFFLAEVIAAIGQRIGELWLK